MRTERNPTDLRQNALDEEEADRQKRIAYDRQVQDMKWLMSTETGRRIMWDLLGFAGVHRDSFTGNSTTFYNEGRRSVGLHYTGLVTTLCPDLYCKMLIEANPTKDDSHAE